MIRNWARILILSYCVMLSHGIAHSLESIEADKTQLNITESLAQESSQDSHFECPLCLQIQTQKCIHNEVLTNKLIAKSQENLSTEYNFTRATILYFFSPRAPPLHS